MVGYFSSFDIKRTQCVNFARQFLLLFKSRNFLSLDLVRPFQIIADKTKVELKVQVKVEK